MDIAELQKVIKKIQKKMENKFDLDSNARIFATMTKVSEEVGEVANELLKKHNLQRDEKLREKHELGKEMADLVITIGSLAHVTDINLDKEITKRIKEIGKRFNL